jgi:hypothetical protein
VIGKKLHRLHEQLGALGELMTAHTAEIAARRVRGTDVGREQAETGMEDADVVGATAVRRQPLSDHLRPGQYVGDRVPSMG